MALSLVDGRDYGTYVQLPAVTLSEAWDIIHALEHRAQCANHGRGPAEYKECDEKLAGQLREALESAQTERRK